MLERDPPEKSHIMSFIKTYETRGEGDKLATLFCVKLSCKDYRNLKAANLDVEKFLHCPAL